ncbi:MAG TPA: uroporphyrinogen-III synthase [Fodinibius sp.]|nr:uroporphyrinogen-III synthase [Fodinibius sp.]
MINILLTRQLNGRQIEYARNLGLTPVIELALEFQFPSYWDDVLKAITKYPRASWVFTSTNGVKAMARLLDAGLQVRQEQLCYAVGAKTQAALQRLGIDAKKPSVFDGKHLAKQIIDDSQTDIVLHFHGNLSREEIVNKLEQANIDVVRLEVYKTIIHPVNLPAAPVEGILFYSPSAVEGFARGQGFDEILPPLFAIGPTTARALAGQTKQQVIISPKADTKALLQTVADYLLRENNTS